MDTRVKIYFFLVDETVLNCTELNEITFEKFFGVFGFDSGDKHTGILRVFEAFPSSEQGLMPFAIGMIDENPFFNEKESQPTIPSITIHRTNHRELRFGTDRSEEPWRSFLFKVVSNADASKYEEREGERWFQRETDQ